MSKAPDRGSFPLDHFHQCDTQARLYSDCVAKHQLMPKRCRSFQINYLQCRMKSGLMEEDQMDKLGFIQSTSWETEEAEKKAILAKIRKVKHQAWSKVKEDYKTKYPQADLPDNPEL